MTISYSDGVLSVLGRWKGSVYKSVLTQLIIYLVLWYFIRLIYFYAMTRHQQAYFEVLVQAFYSNMKSSFAVTFILGFYVSTIVTRWWDQINLIVWPDDLISFATFIFNDNEKTTRIKRHQIARYLVLACGLVFRKLSIRVMKRFPTIDHVVQAGLMNSVELQMYTECEEECGKWMLPLEWISKLLRQRLDEGKVPPPICAAYMGALQNYRENLRRMFVYDWINIPLVYSQVAAIATYSYFALTLIGRQYLDHKKNIPGYALDMYFPIFTALEFVFYVGWFKVGQELMKPWGEDDDDAELNFILDRHMKVAFSISDTMGKQECPPSMEDKFWEASRINLLHTKVSRKILEHVPKSYVSLPDSLDPASLEMSEAPTPINRPRSRNSESSASRTSTTMTDLSDRVDTIITSIKPNKNKRPSLHF